MRKFQLLLTELASSGIEEKNLDGNVRLSLPLYKLEYEFERVVRSKIYGKPSKDGLPLIMDTPKLIIKLLLSDINRLPLREFEEFNRSIQNLKNSNHLLGHLKNGKTIDLPFLKEPGDFRTPRCQISEPNIAEHNKLGSINMDISLYNSDVINKLPLQLDKITLFFCLLSLYCNYSPNKIIFSLICPYCEFNERGKLNEYLQKKPTFKVMKVKPGLASLYTIKKSDIEFSLWKFENEWISSFSFFKIVVVIWNFIDFII